MRPALTGTDSPRGSGDANCHSVLSYASRVRKTIKSNLRGIMMSLPVAHLVGRWEMCRTRAPRPLSQHNSPRRMICRHVATWKLRNGLLCARGAADIPMCGVGVFVWPRKESRLAQPRMSAFLGRNALLPWLCCCADTQDTQVARRSMACILEYCRVLGFRRRA